MTEGEAVLEPMREGEAVREPMGEGEAVRERGREAVREPTRLPKRLAIQGEVVCGPVGGAVRESMGEAVPEGGGGDCGGEAARSPGGTHPLRSSVSSDINS